jgi:hypothetical protein
MGKLRSLKVGATYDDLCAVPENLVAEMFDGELYATPRPPFRTRTRHRCSASSAGLFIAAAMAPAGGGFDEPELHFDADVLVPNLAGWRRPRLASLPTTPYFTLAPD